MKKDLNTTQQGFPAPLAESAFTFALDPVVLAGLLDSLDQGIALLDEDYNLLYSNRQLRQFFGLPSPTALESRLTRLLAGKHRAWLLQTQRERSGVWEEYFNAGRHPVKSRLSNLPPEMLETLGLEADQLVWLLQVRDCSEESAWEQALADARAQAEKSNQARSEFLSHMSHELRTPLNAIVGFTQLLETGAALDEEQKDNLKEIKAASGHLLALINDILDLARAESGKSGLAVESVGSAGVIGECLALVRPLAEKNQVKVRYAGKGLKVATDRMRLKQILLNLVSNAIKYNRSGGSVTIREFRAADGGLRVEVQDTGIGIPPEFLDTLFSPFERLGITSEHIEGAGIGLMITRHLVTLLKGRIGLTSEPGSGSVFWVELPALDSQGMEREADAQRESAPRPVDILCLHSDAELRSLTEKLASLGRPLRFHHLACGEAFSPPRGLSPALILLGLPEDRKAAGALLDGLTGHEGLKNLPLVAVNKGRRAPADDRLSACLNRPLKLLDCLQVLDRLLCPELEEPRSGG